ncbi:cupin-like domain-containing protein [Sorangium atrum]|uniref:Cupin-like domain-containing protein n=1 Tax=Sorangium atrum TaxID=2995308 RepID=A0ABT5BYN9_9BACT|nr:cupin-like domain-containing protein [Sorangium aterium]MDC0678745.1 cupin-like domain-containing protein [Sorangium aterium]
MGEQERELEVAPEWWRWATENLLRGVSEGVISEQLQAAGVSSAQVGELLSAIVRSPIFVAARPFARSARRHEMLARLQQRMASTACDPTGIPRRSGVSGEELRDVYVAGNIPVILTDVVTRWPAFGRWTPAYLSERFGDVVVDVTTGRQSDPDYDMHAARHTESTPLRDFVARIVGAAREETNDFYMVANNRVLERTRLGALLDDVVLPDGYCAVQRLLGASALWLGPAGTVTPLHYDTSNILFGQVYGRKRYRMIAPFETSLFDGARAMYADRDPEQGSMAPVLVKDVVLEPGEALFIPVGWWHHVRALDASISLGINSFPFHNNFDWYRPSNIG